MNRGNGKKILAKEININNNEIQQIVNKLHILEDELVQNSLVPQQNSLGFSHQNFFGTNKLALKEMQNAFQVLQMLLQFAKHRKISVQELINSQIDIRNTDFAQFCPINPTCSSSKYRTVDGSCNNLINTAQGKAVSAYSRLLPPEYSDEINEPRIARSGNQMPNPRSLSLSLSNDNAAENPGYSLMLMSFGQFVTHDISRVAITKSKFNFFFSFLFILSSRKITITFSPLCPSLLTLFVCLCLVFKPIMIKKSNVVIQKFREAHVCVIQHVFQWKFPSQIIF